MQTRKTSFITTTFAVTAIAGSFVGLTGCQTSSTSADSGSNNRARSFTTGNGQYGANPGTYTANNAGAFDPYGASVTGDGSWNFTGAAPSSGPLALSPKTPVQMQPSNVSTDFYGQLLAEQGPGYDAIDPTRASGGSMSQLSFTLEGADFDPCVSPNGEFVVFASTQHAMSSDIYIKSTSSRTTTQLTADPANDVMPVFSPDGSRVAFSSNRSGNWDIFVISSTGGQAMQVTTESSHELHPTWSPDSKFLVFSRLGEISGKWEVWVTEVGNNGVAHFLTYGLFPEWSPASGTGENGTDQIVFQRSSKRGDRSFSVWTIDFNTDGVASNETEIAQSAYHACINPTWSKDGNWISFATVPNPSQWAQENDTRPQNANLWLVSSTGGSLVPLTNSMSVNLMPTFGPDNTVFFVSDRGGVDNIWRLNASGAIIAAGGIASPNSGTISSNPFNASSESSSVAGVDTDSGN